MDRNFLKRKIEGGNIYVTVLSAGMALTLVLAGISWKESAAGGMEGLPRKPAGEGAYEQELVAKTEDGERIPLTVTVEERRLTKEEAEKELEYAAELLPELFKGENESLRKVTKELAFVEKVPGTLAEVEWRTDAWDYFSADMTRRKDDGLKEPVDVLILAVLRCQGEERETTLEVTLFPQERTRADRLEAQIAEESAKSAEKAIQQLPKADEGAAVSWKKPPDVTFFYVFLLTVAAAVFLKLGEKRDEQLKKQKEKEELERDYAGLVSKFTMLLSAGLSIRNAWERITALYQNDSAQKGVLYRALLRSLGELRQGLPETEVYERFGSKTGLVHYKKLMALFVSDKRRGSIPLLEAMEKEMLEAWDEKKRQTRQRGEKTETKLLLPMMGMLSVVFLIILVPAFLSFRM